MANLSDAELTLEAKQAIRNYLLKLVALPALLLSILSFVLGYAFQQASTANALAEDMKILPALVNSSSAAQSASEKANDVKSKTEKVFADTTQLFDQMKKLGDFQTLLKQPENLVSDLAKKVLDDKTFKQEVIAAAGVSIPHAESGRTSTSSLSGHITFQTKFTEAPQIVLGLSHLDEYGPVRVRVEYSNITEKGFDYKIFTFAGAAGMGVTGLGQADALWLAVGH